MLDTGKNKPYDANRGLTRKLPVHINPVGVTAAKIRTAMVPKSTGGCGLLPSQMGKVVISTTRGQPQASAWRDAPQPKSYCAASVKAANTVDMARAREFSRCSSLPVRPNTVPKTKHPASRPDSNRTINLQQTMKRAVNAYQSGRIP